MPANGTEYVCVLTFLNGTADESDPVFLYIAGELQYAPCNMHPEGHWYEGAILIRIQMHGYNLF